MTTDTEIIEQEVAATSNKSGKNIKAEDIKLEDYRIHEGDTGSADYQIAKLTIRIKQLTEHMGEHKKDFSSRRGLLRLVAQRRKLLDYLNANAEERYHKVLKGLGLRR